MKRNHHAISAFSAALALGACEDSNLSVEPRLVASTAGRAPADGGSGRLDPICNGDCACEGACCPADDQCYVDKGGVGDECLAQRNNSQGGPNGDVLEFRLTWSRSISPEGNANPTVYGVLSNSSGLPWPECNMVNGQSEGLAGGFVQGLRLDLKNDFAIVGFSTFVNKDSLADVRANGICMLDAIYDDPNYRLTAEEMAVDIASEGWPEALPRPMPQPWHIAPTRAKRVDEDFDVSDPDERLELLDRVAAEPDFNALVYVDEDTGYAHGYAPQSWVVVYTTENNHIAMPIREAQTFYQLNDPIERSCIGAFRGDALEEGTCTASNVPTNPPWGCAKGQCEPGEAPGRTEGYFLITELDQVYTTALGETLCVSYPGDTPSADDGFPKPRCKNSPLWNPSDLKDGLPHGDWCAKTNSKATEDCHDAFYSVTYQTFQGFEVRDDETCDFDGNVN